MREPVQRTVDESAPLRRAATQLPADAAEMPRAAMRQPSPASEAGSKPSLLFFFDPRSGPSRRAEGYLSAVLQRRGNHETFRIYRVDLTEHSHLAEKFAIERAPVLLVVEHKRVKARLEQPRGSKQLTQFLEPWLR